MRLPRINYPETPNGKRSIRRNIYGNIVGYVAGKRFWEFGMDSRHANFWVIGYSLEEARVL